MHNERMNNFDTITWTFEHRGAEQWRTSAQGRDAYAEPSCVVIDTGKRRHQRAEWIGIVVSYGGGGGVVPLFNDRNSGWEAALLARAQQQQIACGMPTADDDEGLPGTPTPPNTRIPRNAMFGARDHCGAVRHCNASTPHSVSDLYACLAKSWLLGPGSNVYCTWWDESEFLIISPMKREYFINEIVCARNEWWAVAAAH